MRFSKKFAHVVLLLSLFIFVTFLYALEDKGKKVLTIKDYDRWRSIVSASISDNGNWSRNLVQVENYENQYGEKMKLHYNVHITYANGDFRVDRGGVVSCKLY